MQVQFKSKPRAPDELGGVKILYAKARGKGHRLAWYLILLVVLSPIFVLLSGVVGSWLTLTANGTVSLEQHEVRAVRAARISRLTVAVGDRVEAGATLAELDSLDLDAAAAHNAVERQAAAQAQRGAYAQQQAALDELRLKERYVRYQRQRRDEIAALVDEGAATVAELDTAETAVTEAEVELVQLRATAARMPAASTAEVDHELLERQQDSMILTAPFGGRVLELGARQGEYVAPGEPVVVLARTDTARVLAYASPKFGTQLKVGMQATIRFPDGTRIRALIAEPPPLTQRMPADLVDQFGLRPMTVVLNLLPQERLSETQRVQGLPVTVRFHYAWESSGIGGFVGGLLGDLSR
ncbi:MAG TPA: HlyD family efflux transporter periplasmic adaptor subunit [Steroidobacteraceae bacterium]|nr:HlyD family efflux transporter periplasmic adaptor subunit [Steroidobacteraceae bacterium]